MKPNEQPQRSAIFWLLVAMTGFIGGGLGAIAIIGLALLSITP